LVVDRRVRIVDSQGRRTKEEPQRSFEDEDAASGEPGRRDIAYVSGQGTR
jgi:hypothetical protein